MFHELTEPDRLVDRAIEVATQTPDDCLEAYAFTKRAMQAAALRDIADLADRLHTELPDGMTADASRRAHRRYWRDLKGTDPTW